VTIDTRQLSIQNVWIKHKFSSSLFCSRYIQCGRKITMYKKLLLSLPLTLALVCVNFLCVVHAAAMAYSYTGNNFTQFAGVEGVFTTSDRVTASFAINCALAHAAGDCRNLPYQNYYESGAVEQTSLSFSAGPARLPTAGGDVNVERFSFSTDSSGRILEWDLDLFWPDPSGVINVDTDGGLDSAAALGGGAVVSGRPGRWINSDSAPNITGAWNATIYWGTACRWDGTLEFSHAGNPGVLTGSGNLTVAPGNSCTNRIGPVNGTIDGSNLEFIFPEGVSGEGTLTGIVSGNSMAGTWISNNPPGFSGTWNASRASVTATATAIPALPLTALALLGLMITMLALRSLRLH
jgi:hypothetical protein